MNIESLEIITNGSDLLTQPEILQYNEKMSERIIYINEDIDNFVIDYSLLILKWNREDKEVDNPKPIKIFINSNGGDLSAILNLIDVIQISKTPVYTIGLGNCYSSGGLLLMSGHKRFVFKNTTFLLHDGYGGAVNSTGKAMDSFKFTEKQEEKVKDYIISQTKIDSKMYDENYRKDWFMFSEDIIHYGIADVVIKDISEIL